MELVDWLFRAANLNLSQLRADSIKAVMQRLIKHTTLPINSEDAERQHPSVLPAVNEKIFRRPSQQLF
jgi:hypothetical protein